jgi:hypothetical protein
MATHRLFGELCYFPHEGDKMDKQNQKFHGLAVLTLGAIVLLTALTSCHEYQILRII